MNLREMNALNAIGKTLAKPLSLLVGNSKTEKYARLFEAYWCILLGKGAGTGWALDVEVSAAKSVINSASPILFDVGANKGEWSLLMHQHFPLAKVFLFEPQLICQGIIKSKEIPNSTLIPSAVSSINDSTKFYTPGNAAGSASIHQRRDSYFQEKDFSCIDVNTVTIDEMVKAYALTCIDFLKMDIEGHELEALKGAKKSLESGVIKALSFEFGSANINSRTFFHDFWDFLHPLNYIIYRILPSSRLMLIKEYYEDCEYFRGATNYIAVAAHQTSDYS